MIHKILPLLAIVLGAGCAGYLLCNTIELEDFFLTRWISKRCFPKLDAVRRHQRMQLLCGVILAIILIGFGLNYVIQQNNHR